MREVDWYKIYEATSTNDRPTPGYLFAEITYNLSWCHPREVPAVAAYLADCVDGDHAHVKLKALLAIKHLAFRIPLFRACIRLRHDSLEAARHVRGPHTTLCGDEPYRLVREAAAGAWEVIAAERHYHDHYEGMGWRIVGFGNYVPGDNTLLADGCINAGSGFSLRTVAWGTLGLALHVLGAVLGGVKCLLLPGGHAELGKVCSTEWTRGRLDDDTVDAHRRCSGGMGYGEDDVDIEHAYLPEVGSYVPPPLPPSSPSTAVPQLIALSDGCPSHEELHFGGLAHQHTILARAGTAATAPLRACRISDREASANAKPPLWRRRGRDTAAGMAAATVTELPPMVDLGEERDLRIYDD